MAHVTKFTKEQAVGIGNHIDRKTNNHTNESIDISLTPLNYSFLNDGLDFHVRLKNRLSAVSVLNRKNVNVISSWVVTLPETLLNVSEHSQREFFESTHDFLVNRYGGLKNTVASVVHVDETTPHLHYSFVPTVFDEKRGMDRVNAKAVITRTDLQSFHSDLDTHLRQTIPHIYKNDILNGQTLGVDSVEELKLHDRVIQNAKSKVQDLEIEYQAKKEFIKSVDESSKISMAMPDYAKQKKNVLTKRETVTVPLEKWQERHISVSEKRSIEQMQTRLESEIKKFKDSNSYEVFLQMKRENEFYREQVIELEEEIHTLKEQAFSYKVFSAVLENSKDMLIKNFKTVQRVIELIPHLAIKDFCLAGLESIFTEQNNEFDYNKTLKAAVDGWNEGIEFSREKNQLVNTYEDLELIQEIKQSKSYDFSL